MVIQSLDVEKHRCIPWRMEKRCWDILFQLSVPLIGPNTSDRNKASNILTYLLFQKNLNSNIIGSADTSYFYDPHNTRSQTGFMYLHGGLAIPLMSSKQTLQLHPLIILKYKVSHQYVGLYGMINHINIHVVLVLLKLQLLSTR